MGNDLLYIVMPAYNEQDNIHQVVAEWHPVVVSTGENARLLIVNDGSKDNTYKELVKLQEQYPQLIAIDKPNSGHGATVLFAYRKALAAGADYIFQTDSDGQTLPSEFERFWENRYKYDFIIGKRNNRQDGFGRIVVTRVLRLLVWIMFGEWVNDANTPFRLMKADRLAKILTVVPEDFFLSNVAISTIAVKWKESCRWIPITFRPRQGGVNSINFKRIFKIGWKAIGDFGEIKRRLKAAQK
ncbi:MAG: glycosyltransferase family 2 protein [Dysgonamonadaceae bacterium]|jgi:glycosyltransferase involved in cell wall biosynthesis|nr:glycosyltransferase family 2 protein [Dysgonamonadaceae bacterium]